MKIEPTFYCFDRSTRLISAMVFQDDQIRLALLSDIEACVAIDAPNFHIFDREKRRDHFLKMIPLGGLLLLERGGKILAYASFDADWFGCTLLKLVVVDLTARRRGLASKLIHQIERDHCPSGRFFSSTEDDNQASKELHRKLGFVESGWLDNLPQPHHEIFYYKQLPKG